MNEKTVTIEPLNVDNWLTVCELTISDEQKPHFPIPNLYWIGISRYEEHSELFAIKQGETYVGLIGGGLDEDGVSGYINPLMVDTRFQHQGIGGKALRLMMDKLIRKYQVPCIHINHRKDNHAAARLYEQHGFSVYATTENEDKRSYSVAYDASIKSLREHPQWAEKCQAFLLEHFNEYASTHPAQVLSSTKPFPQGYVMVQDERVIGWTGLHEQEVVSGPVYGWVGGNAPHSGAQEQEIRSEDLTPWITPLLVDPHHRGNRYGKFLLEHARKEAGRLGCKQVHLTTGEIGYYEKYGFREVGLTTFNWGRPTKIYQHDTLL
jgi:ribosomal protein S18 acetylase RimI-like enzyme